MRTAGASDLHRDPRPGAADADAQAAVDRRCLVDRRLYLLLLAHVAGDEAGAELGGERLAVLDVDVGDRQLGALPAEAPRRRLAQPRRSADDQRSTALDVHAAGP